MEVLFIPLVLKLSLWWKLAWSGRAWSSPAQCGCSQVVLHLCLCRLGSFLQRMYFFNFLKSENLSSQKPSSPVGFQNRYEPDRPLSPGSCQHCHLSWASPPHPASTTSPPLCGSSVALHAVDKATLSRSTFVAPKTQIEYRGVMLMTSSSNSIPQGSRSFPFPNFLLQGERHRFFCAFFFF